MCVIDNKRQMRFKYDGNPELEEYVQKQRDLMQKGEISELDFFKELVKLQQEEIEVLGHNLKIWQIRYYNKLAEGKSVIDAHPQIADGRLFVVEPNGQAFIVRVGFLANEKERELTPDEYLIAGIKKC